MKVYIAAPWISRVGMPEVATAFEAAGHTITHKWWDYEGKGEEFETEDFMRQCAIKDYRGVVNANVIVVLDTAKSEGKAVEQGIAIANKKPIILVKGDNPSHNIFHHLSNYHKVDNIQDAITKVGEV